MKVFGKHKQVPNVPIVSVSAYKYAFFTYNACRYVLSHPEEFPVDVVSSCRNEFVDMQNSDEFMQVYSDSLKIYDEIGL